jgi:3-oxoacyl-[acyl-carrier-protein] synthase-1
MSLALQTANISPNDIDYINAHGTGTVANDEAEAAAVAKLFAAKPYISSTKSTTGHTLGACGALEAIVCCEVLKHQVVPKNKLKETNFENINLNTTNIKKRLKYAMSNSFAFGGNNCSLVFKI